MKELSPKVKASMKYDKANVKQVKLSLNKKTDSDVIAILESKDNVQGYIKELIRTDIDLDGLRKSYSSGFTQVKKG